MGMLEEVKMVFEEERYVFKTIRNKQKTLKDSIRKSIDPIFASTEWFDISIDFPDQTDSFENDEDIFGDPVILVIHAKRYSPNDPYDPEPFEFDIFDKLTIFFETKKVWIIYQPDTVAGYSIREKHQGLQSCDSIESYVKCAMDHVCEWEEERDKTRERVARYRFRQIDEPRLSYN